MGPVLTIALVGIVAALSWRAVRREYGKVVDALKGAETSLSKKAPETLERDPETGVYRPAKREE
jgi:hypothetical protein